ncbi:predicted protein [Lichtheimia corymbifera JMRC:FSU:9682]|uniref:Uncharacterized protein n=1 Tax=Lichtheimia corymbifera JMRC:FSU:9682 TaxID=1263082 RepID=A0A068RE49_9FUNG|nr:predicted protein [Lichtheimia corymbifera JMRC:FSU:9682]
MSSTLDSRWATDTDRRRADEGQNVSRFTAALQASRDLHPASDQQPQHNDNNRWTSSPTYNSTGWKRSNYQSDKRKVTSSPLISRPWNVIALKNKKPVEQKSSSPPPPPPPPRQESESSSSTDSQAMQSTPITSSAQYVSFSSVSEKQQQQQQQQPTSEKVPHGQNPVSDHEHDDYRNYPHETRQSTLDEQMLNLRIESGGANNNDADLKQKVLETEKVGTINSQPQNSGSMSADAYDIQEEIRREREANAARKLRAAQAREWDCDKSMEGWT